MTDAIVTRNLAWRAGKDFSIRDLAMTVQSGSIYGFLGPNGSGKTTVIRLILGMLRAHDGLVTVLGHDVPDGVHHALARTGFVPERLHLYPTLTVEETIRCAEIAVEEVKGQVPVIIGIIRDSTREVIRYGRALKQVRGVDALQITPVHYLFTPGPEGSYAYYKEIGQAVGLPIVIYNVVPWNTISPETLLWLSEIPEVIAVKQSGGDISVHSEVGRGTTITIDLPQAVGAPLAGGIAHAAATVRGTETILVAEDDAGIRQIVKRMLESAGYTVLVAPHGEEALQLLERQNGPVDLLLTDVVMPAMSGRDLAQRIRRRRPAIKILYTSGYTDDAIMHHGVLDEEVHFIGKPYTTAALTRKVREVLDS